MEANLSRRTRYHARYRGADQVENSGTYKRTEKSRENQSEDRTAHKQIGKSRTGQFKFKGLVSHKQHTGKFWTDQSGDRRTTHKTLGSAEQVNSEASLSTNTPIDSQLISSKIAQFTNSLGSAEKNDSKTTKSGRNPFRRLKHHLIRTKET